MVETPKYTIHRETYTGHTGTKRFIHTYKYILTPPAVIWYYVHVTAGLSMNGAPTRASTYLGVLWLYVQSFI